MSAPQIFMQSVCSSNVEERSVTIDCPTISIASSHSPCSSTNRSDATIAAPAPSEVGEHCSFVNGSWIIGASAISCSEYSVWNCA